MVGVIPVLSLGGQLRCWLPRPTQALIRLTLGKLMIREAYLLIVIEAAPHHMVTNTNMTLTMAMT